MPENRAPWREQPPASADLSDFGRQFTNIYAPLARGRVPYGGGPPLSSDGDSRGVFPQGLATVYTAFANVTASLAVRAVYPMTVLWIGQFVSAGANWRVADVPGLGGGNGDAFGIELHSGTEVRGTQRNGFFSSLIFPTLAPTGAAISNTDLVVLWQSVSRTDHRLYAGGKMVTASTDAGPMSSSKTTFHIASSIGANQRTYLAGVGNNAVSDEEALQLTLDPSEAFGLLFAPRRIWVPVSAGAAGIAGTLASTLDGATVASTGTVRIAGTSAVTLDGATSSAASTLRIAGTSAVTLGGATVSSAGALRITGTSAVTLADATVAATGTVVSGITGSAAITLADATVASASTLRIAGTSAQTLAGATVSSAGALQIKGTSTVTLDGATVAATGTTQATTTGTAAIALAGATVSAASALRIAGSVGVTLAGATAASASTLRIAGAAANVLDGASVSAAASLALRAALARTLDGAALAATGILVAPNFGALARTLAGATLSATGVSGELDFGSGEGELIVAADDNTFFVAADDNSMIVPADDYNAYV